MKIGYPCINLGLSCRSSRTFRLASYSPERMKKTVESNLACLLKTLEYNVKHTLLFFRISSDLIPFASHEVCAFHWQDVFGDTFGMIGEYMDDHDFRISMHPDQFVLLNSLDETIFSNSVKEIQYHAEVLDLLGMNETAKIQIHVGGVYGDKEKSIERFIRRYETLPDKIRKRLVIENDERLYSVADCLEIHRETGIPVVFDSFHFSCNNSGEPLREAFEKTALTWSHHDGIPVADYSSQQKEKKTGSHAASIDIRNFRKFLKETEGFDFDIMLEIKDKERSALKALDVVAAL